MADSPQGVFVVCDATNGFPLGIFQENRYLTDLRTGAAGAVSVKYFASKKHAKVAYIGTGVIATAMAVSTHTIHQFAEGFAYGLDQKQAAGFAGNLTNQLGYTVKVYFN